MQGYGPALTHFGKNEVAFELLFRQSTFSI